MRTDAAPPRAEPTKAAERGPRILVALLDFAAQQSDLATTVKDRMKMLWGLTLAGAVIIVALGIAATLMLGGLAFLIGPNMPRWGYGVAAAGATGLGTATALFRMYLTLRTDAPATPSGQPAPSGQQPSEGPPTETETQQTQTEAQESALER